MPKYKIADIVCEYTPLYDNLEKLSRPFLYKGDEEAKIKLNISEEYIKTNLARMQEGTPLGDAENFFVASAFNRRIIKHNAMLIHSSAIKYNGKAYLFSARSGVGKSTHTKLWIKEFGKSVTVINDDKPVVRIFDDDTCIAYGTPFDGGSGIAVNDSAPLGAVVFIERAEENSVRKATTREIVNNLYFATARYVGKSAASVMLENFNKLLGLTDFYILSCNMDASAAHTARDAIVK